MKETALINKIVAQVLEKAKHHKKSRETNGVANATK